MTPTVRLEDDHSVAGTLLSRSIKRAKPLASLADQTADLIHHDGTKKFIMTIDNVSDHDFDDEVK